MLAQTETKSKAPFGNRNDRTDRSDGLDPQLTKLKKHLSLALREVSNLRNQLNQAKENIVKDHAERSSKSRKDDCPDAEVGGKRPRQQAKRAKALRPGTSFPNPPRIQVRHGRVSEYFRLVTTVTRRRKRIIRNRMQEQLSQRQSLLAFNQLSRRRLHDWMLSPDLQGQGQGKL